MYGNISGVAYQDFHSLTEQSEVLKLDQLQSSLNSLELHFEVNL